MLPLRPALRRAGNRQEPGQLPLHSATRLAPRTELGMLKSPLGQQTSGPVCHSVRSAGRTGSCEVSGAQSRMVHKLSAGKAGSAGANPSRSGASTSCKQWPGRTTFLRRQHDSRWRTSSSSGPYLMSSTSYLTQRSAFISSSDMFSSLGSQRSLHTFLTKEVIENSPKASKY